MIDVAMMPTDAEIDSLLRPLYCSDEAAEMARYDDRFTARAVLAKWGNCSTSVPPGYKVVPIEPDSAIRAAFNLAIERWLGDEGDDDDVYRSLIAAAPLISPQDAVMQSRGTYDCPRPATSPLDESKIESIYRTSMEGFHVESPHYFADSATKPIIEKFARAIEREISREK